MSKNPNETISIFGLATSSRPGGATISWTSTTVIPCEDPESATIDAIRDNLLAMFRRNVEKFPGATVELEPLSGAPGLVVTIRVDGRVVLQANRIEALQAGLIIRTLKGDALRRGVAMARRRGLPVTVEDNLQGWIEAVLQEDGQVYGYVSSVADTDCGTLATYASEDVSERPGSIPACALAVAQFLGARWKDAGKSLPEDDDVLS